MPISCANQRQSAIPNVRLTARELFGNRISLPHLPKDFGPALGQTTQGRRVRLPLLAFVLVIHLSPDALIPAQVGQVVQRDPKGLVAGAPEAHPAVLAGLFGHRSRASITLQTFG